MRTLVPELAAITADPAGDAASLARLAAWCRRWCPWTAADGDDGIVLDSSGSAHLWGGETAMLADMAARLGAAGFSARIAAAPTRGAAHALARFGRDALTVCDEGEVGDRLAPLPAASLRLDADIVLLLKRLGLKTVGDLAAVPRLSFARRFRKAALAVNPLLRLDQAFGRLAEPVTAALEVPPPRAQQRLAEPALDIAPLLAGLLDALCGQLTAAGLGARRLSLAAFRVDGDIGIVEASASRASRDPVHLARLFAGKFETLDPGFGFDAVALEAVLTEPLGAEQANLAGKGESVRLAELVDRIVARLGPEAISVPRFTESHLPERAERWVGAADVAAPGDTADLRERPIRLLRRPEEVRVVYGVPEGPPAHFEWRRLQHRIVRYEGPERIAPEWWRAKSTTRLRDYYKVEDAAGRRYWLFREGVHGDGRGGAPRWFVHGLFA